MNIVSNYTEGSALPDGRIPVEEKHTLEDGRVFKYEYICPADILPQYVMEERASVINVTLVAREAARQLIMGTSVPITKHDFIARFTPAEYVAIEAAAAHDPIIKMFLLRLNSSGAVYHYLAMQGLYYLNYLGLLTAERMAVIGEAW